MRMNAELHPTPDSKLPPRRAAARGLAPRERLLVLGAAVAALCLVVVWNLTGRDVPVDTTAMGEINRPAPAFVLPALDGGDIDLSALRGRIVLVNFWGTWCEPCTRELPALQAAHQELQNAGLTIIGVNLTDDEIVQGRDLTQVAAFLADYGVTYPIALDMEGSVTQDYRVFPLPTSFFIDHAGQIRYVHIGELKLDDIRERFTELNSEAAAAPGTN